MTTERRSLTNPLNSEDLEELEKAQSVADEVDQAIVKAGQAGINTVDLVARSKTQREQILRLLRTYGRNAT